MKPQIPTIICAFDKQKCSPKPECRGCKYHPQETDRIKMERREQRIEKFAFWLKWNDINKREFIVYVIALTCALIWAGACLYRHFVA